MYCLSRFQTSAEKKLRPALLLADAGQGDWVACQITSNPYADARAITLAESEFIEGGLQRVSFLRLGKLFTRHESLPVNTVGLLKKAALQQARVAVIQMIHG